MENEKERKNKLEELKKRLQEVRQEEEKLDIEISAMEINQINEEAN